MNKFEEYTAIIGLLAVLIEGTKHLWKKVKTWLRHV